MSEADAPRLRHRRRLHHDEAGNLLAVVGRPSQVRLDMQVAQGQLTRVRIGGPAVQFLSGSFELERARIAYGHDRRADQSFGTQAPPPKR